MKPRDGLTILGWALLLVLAASPEVMAADAAAEVSEAETTYPFVEGVAYLELGDDWTYRSDDPGSEINDLYFFGTLDLKFGLTPMFSVNFGLTGEDVKGEYLPFEDRNFKDTGVYVHALNLQADAGNATVLAGKFGPNFGLAWDNAPGVFGTYFAEDYELAEKIGLSAAYAFQTEGTGTHTLGASAFFADTSFLSDSIFTRRGRTSLDDGGVSNTENLDSFVVSLDGADIPAVTGLIYHLAYGHLAAGLGDASDENRYVASVAKDTELSNGMILTTTGELAYFDSYGGTDDDALYLTSGIGLSSGPWHGELSGALRKFDYAVGDSTTDRLIQVSGGYGFENGFDLSLGYAFQRVSELDYHTLGLRLTKSFEFSSNSQNP